MKFFKKITLVLCAASLASCSDFFEQTPDNMLDADDNYTERSNIYASFMGLYGTLQDVAPKLVVTSELWGDLLTPTDQAPDSYWEVFRYDVQPDNSVADPAPLYRIVMNCNDFMRNTIEYNKSYPGVIPTTTYRQMIAGAVALRTWAYLNIGKLYGKAVYYDYAMTGETDLSKLPVLTFDELIPELIHFMNTGVDNINGLRGVDINTMFGTTGIWNSIAISPDALLCELYLWNKDYESAAKRGINLITGQALTPAGDNNKFTLSEQFGKTKQWSSLFSDTPANPQTNEGLTMVLYDYSQRQINPLYSLFSSETVCEYYMKPTAVLTSRFSLRADYQMTGSQVAKDPRTDPVTFTTSMGENYDAADAILNNGFQPYWVSGNRYNPPFDAPIYAYEKLKAGRGVRGRLSLPAVRSTDERFMGALDPGSPEYAGRRRQVLDSLIIEETGRELAGEGKRWFTIMRMARNSNNPSMLARMIMRKFPVAERPAYYAKLKDPANWFIDYDLKLDK